MATGRDYTTHAIEACNSIGKYEARIPSNNTNETYVVRHEKLLPEESERQGVIYGWTCTCKGFKYRMDCRHIREVRQAQLNQPGNAPTAAIPAYCGWNSKENGGKALIEPGTNRLICPICGGYCGVYTEAD